MHEGGRKKESSTPAEVKKPSPSKQPEAVAPNEASFSLFTRDALSARSGRGTAGAAAGSGDGDGGTPKGEKAATDMGPGFGLPASSRTRMERTLGGSLSEVRVHTGGKAAQLAARHGALAVTEGQDIAFARNTYRPGTAFGEGVLAHELAHTRQQQGAKSGAGGRARAPSRALESEADHAGFAAALRLLDPDRAERLGPVRLSTGQGLQLQACAPPDYSEIEELPTREDYERSGELMPRYIDDMELAEGPFLGLPEGQLTLGPLGPEAESAPAPSTEIGPSPLPSDLGAAAETLSADQLRTRLSALEVVHGRIETALSDLNTGGPLRLSSFVFSSARMVLEPDYQPLTFELVGGGAGTLSLGLPGEMVPSDLPGLSREVVRSESVLSRSLDALNALGALRDQEVSGSQNLADYPVDDALFDIDEVRRAYQRATDAVLTPQAVDLYNTAVESHQQLPGQLLQRKLDHFQGRTSEFPEIQDSIDEMQSWAWWLQEKLNELQEEAPRLQEARASRDEQYPQMQRRFVRKASLIATSVEALGEWDMAVQAFEYLRGNSALWGYEGVERIAWRLGQMKDAALDEDLPYLEVLLRDHRGDPHVSEYYASLPDIVGWSQFIIMMGITLVAIVVTAGVGIVVAPTVSGVVAGAGGLVGLAAESQIVVGATFLAQTGVEAFVFTAVSRQLSSLVPGMEPTSSFWTEFFWNWGLFGVMKGAVAGVQAALLARGVTGLASLAITQGTAYSVLQAYGYLRFAIETGRAMTAEEFARMSIQNAIMLVGLSVGMRAFEPALARLQSATSLRTFQARYGERFAEIETDRAALNREAQQRLEENPQATAEDLVDLNGRATEIDARLRRLVDEVAEDSDVNISTLQSEAREFFARFEESSVSEILTEAGLDPSLDLRPSGTESAWSYPPGRTSALVAFLRSAGYEVSPEVTLTNGRQAVEATISGKGRVYFIERAPRAQEWTRLESADALPQSFHDLPAPRLPTLPPNYEWVRHGERWAPERRTGVEGPELDIYWWHDADGVFHCVIRSAADGRILSTSSSFRDVSYNRSNYPEARRRHPTLNFGEGDEGHTGEQAHTPRAPESRVEPTGDPMQDRLHYSSEHPANFVEQPRWYNQDMRNQVIQEIVREMRAGGEEVFYRNHFDYDPNPPQTPGGDLIPRYEWLIFENSAGVVQRAYRVDFNWYPRNQRANSLGLTWRAIADRASVDAQSADIPRPRVRGGS